ncbi:hypothetical protein ACVWW2_001833 [Bradyrhizobium sp. LM4.3]
MHHGWVNSCEGRRLVFQFGDDALGDLGADAGRARHRGLIAQRDRVGEVGRLQRAEHGKRDLGADALHGLEQAKPFALVVAAEAEQFDQVLADIGFDRQHGGLALRRQMLQRARRAMHLITDTADIENDEILAVGIDQALELADHNPTTFSLSAVLVR